MLRTWNLINHKVYEKNLHEISSYPMTLEELYHEDEMNMLIEVKILITSRY